MAKSPLHEHDALQYPDLDLWRALVPVSAFVRSLLLIAAFSWPCLSRYSLLYLGTDGALQPPLSAAVARVPCLNRFGQAVKRGGLRLFTW
ncbi:hypothetical protein SAMN04487998_3594 [Hymenobacter actinosclerus]|uniref:Uncharacterized protein n=1 Tax=Hymenobacter actinosclerus TaxID=82805 RepID=A0A1I0J1W6_9BACT|nr:hypothetical protein SAMN04487998_3594 [Hymenobacter actinosclerus]